MEKLNFPEDLPIENGFISKSIESAQTKIEGANFDSRKYTLEYDDVLNKHRDVFYKQRYVMLEKSEKNILKEEIVSLFEKYNIEISQYDKKEQELGSDNLKQAVKIISLRVMDTYWTEHLENMEHLRDSVRLRAYGQRDPLVEYKKEGNLLFKTLVVNYENAIINSILSLAPAVNINSPQKQTENEKLVEE
ncbi:preprotein translocase subunit SecA, partial [bacterium]|nr:preprotein translocase subunit SecA [bacterium]